MFTIARTIYIFRKPIVYALLFIAIVLIATIAAISVNEQQRVTDMTSFQSGQVSESVRQWETQIQQELQKYGLEQHIYLVMAIMMQESGGHASLDVMQASESLGLPPNTIIDPLYSIEVGVRYFASVMEAADKAGVDIETAIQSYNFGSGYISYVAARGGKHTKVLAEQFSALQQQKLGWNRYGDVSYVEHVTRYVGAKDDSGSYSTLAAATTGDLNAVLAEMLKYEGWPYQWAGMDPSTSFDCSGLMMWSFRKIGIHLPRTAQEQFNATARISEKELQPGDLIFFTRTYEAAHAVTHVGLYIGNGVMYDANGGGIGYSSILEPYWQSHLYGYGRIANFSL
ncbi:MAG: bifunctional lytic transglycosylase/C40 family peptidase [Caryophanon sp.]|nr:bifunctional lytic transglycosylase/C40 family peptidase [Caryophanon sp.]